jgi:hypothetical protein
VEDLKLGTSSAKLIRRCFCATWKPFHFIFIQWPRQRKCRMQMPYCYYFVTFSYLCAYYFHLDLTAIVPSFVLCPDLFIIFRSCFRLFWLYILGRATKGFFSLHSRTRRHYSTSRTYIIKINRSCCISCILFPFCRKLGRFVLFSLCLYPDILSKPRMEQNV